MSPTTDAVGQVYDVPDGTNPEPPADARPFFNGTVYSRTLVDIVSFDYVPIYQMIVPALQSMPLRPKTGQVVSTTHSAMYTIAVSAVPPHPGFCLCLAIINYHSRWPAKQPTWRSQC